MGTRLLTACYQTGTRLQIGTRLVPDCYQINNRLSPGSHQTAHRLLPSRLLRVATLMENRLALARALRVPQSGHELRCLLGGNQPELGRRSVI